MHTEERRHERSDDVGNYEYECACADDLQGLCERPASAKPACDIADDEQRDRREHQACDLREQVAQRKNVRQQRNEGARSKRAAHEERGTQPGVFRFARIDTKFITHHFVQPNIRIFHQALHDHRRLVGREAFEPVVGDLLGKFFLGMVCHLSPLECDGVFDDFAFALSAQIFSGRHRNRADHKRNETSQQNG